MALTYRQAGVDIDAGDALVERIKPLARSTRIAEVVDDVGGFAGLCALPADVEEPLLVSGTDGVGTKLKVAFATGRHDTVGIDLVAMCVNDVITTGARPLFFLDYFACGKLDVDVAEAVVAGVANGCRQAGAALLGGETAELPGMYPEGEYDLAGFSVGVVGRKAVLGPARVRSGDALIAVASSGLHSNGYSLARRVLEGELGLRLDAHHPELDATVGEALLTPTRIYARAVAALQKALGESLHALSHITGGGVVGNLPRVLPSGTRAEVRFDHSPPPIFGVIARGGPVAPDEMRRTFNMGIGLIAIVASEHAEAACRALGDAGEQAWVCGSVVAEPDAEPSVSVLE
ncbi:MAG: phosphoribosylformylglycinamidine cyclo-ligase [Myxococcales bacterium]|nr:phosphoribosylformylglycinamidine cyclo-ligase [Myxococcales bacterium]MCB9580034.1 phosphoribosylformylglycinamidine cyclo-ligase [Polyangiaceae bacterium]